MEHGNRQKSYQAHMWEPGPPGDSALLRPEGRAPTGKRCITPGKNPCLIRVNPWLKNALNEA